ncbi:DinB family protein [Paenibacillus albus]|uniref:DUF664 domain-containing protein n=1 Tax=Paenibacillus albus TaxID=2495582 RepID=A0A3S9A1B8_9BACL|nr:DinB family protein [Paenibacillus albus]AZN39444.1 DUF664 domain-containing protein [Paenibacillus albus]
MVKALFQYNWLVRDEWFRLLETVPEKELAKKQLAGVGSFLDTMLHIIDVEYSWFRTIVKKPDIQFDPAEYGSLAAIKALSDKLRPEIEAVLDGWSHEQDGELVSPSWQEQQFYRKDEIWHHMIVHEIHHIGQFSVWAKELGVKSASANFIGRGLL